MRFNKVVKSFLNEEERLSRLERIKTLKNVDTIFVIPEEEMDVNMFTIDDILSSGYGDFNSWHMRALRELFKQIRDEYGEAGVKQTKDAYTVKHNEYIAQLDPDDEEDWNTRELYEEEYSFIMSL